MTREAPDCPICDEPMEYEGLPTTRRDTEVQGGWVCLYCKARSDNEEAHYENMADERQRRGA